jgi:hypothetical protein
MVKMPEITGKLIQLAIQLGDDKVGKLPENMFMNQVPHNRYVRNYFYDGAAQATLEACILCSQGQLSNRMVSTNTFFGWSSIHFPFLLHFLTINFHPIKTRLLLLCSQR